MTVKELITRLLECDLNAKVGIITSNKDLDGKRYTYDFSGIERQPIWDSEECVKVQYLMFKDWRYESEDTKKIFAESNKLVQNVKIIGNMSELKGKLEFIRDYECKIDAEKEAINEAIEVIERHTQMVAALDSMRPATEEEIKSRGK